MSHLSLHHYHHQQQEHQQQQQSHTLAPLLLHSSKRPPSNPNPPATTAATTGHHVRQSSSNSSSNNSTTVKSPSFLDGGLDPFLLSGTSQYRASRPSPAAISSVDAPQGMTTAASSAARSPFSQHSLSPFGAASSPPSSEQYQSGPPPGLYSSREAESRYSQPAPSQLSAPTFASHTVEPTLAGPLHQAPSHQPQQQQNPHSSHLAPSHAPTHLAAAAGYTQHPQSNHAQHHHPSNPLGRNDFDSLLINHQQQQRQQQNNYNSSFHSSEDNSVPHRLQQHHLLALEMAGHGNPGTSNGMLSPSPLSATHPGKAGGPYSAYSSASDRASSPGQFSANNAPQSSSTTTLAGGASSSGGNNSGFSLGAAMGGADAMSSAGRSMMSSTGSVASSFPGAQGGFRADGGINGANAEDGLSLYSSTMQQHHSDGKSAAAASRPHSHSHAHQQTPNVYLQFNDAALRSDSPTQSGRSTSPHNSTNTDGQHSADSQQQRAARERFLSGNSNSNVHEQQHPGYWRPSPEGASLSPAVAMSANPLSQGPPSMTSSWSEHANQQAQIQHQQHHAALLAAAASASSAAPRSGMTTPAGGASLVGNSRPASSSPSEFSIFVGDLAPNLREEDLVAQFLRPPMWPPAHPLAIAHARHSRRAVSSCLAKSDRRPSLAPSRQRWVITTRSFNVVE